MTLYIMKGSRVSSLSHVRYLHMFRHDQVMFRHDQVKAVLSQFLVSFFCVLKAEPVPLKFLLCAQSGYFFRALR